MLLQEEYLKRHSLENVQIVNYVTNGSVLLRTEAARYILMTIKWEDNPRHPGKFNIDFHMPVHNGYTRSVFFRPVTECSYKLEWDEYLGFLIKWAKGQAVDPVMGDKEVILAAWDIFIYGCDDWFAEYASSSLEKLICSSIDDDVPLDERFIAYQEAMVLISTEYPDVLRVYKHEMLPSIQNYCHWLAKLIKQSR